MTQTTQLIHATSVYLDGYGVLIAGPSGIGKSALALELLNDAHGFDFVLMNSGSNFLVADDQTYVGKATQVGGRPLVDASQPQLIMRCPDNIKGKFEVRGLGIIKLPSKSPAPLNLYVELVHALPARMPELKNQSREILGIKIAYLQIHKDDRHAKAKVKAALYAHSRNKLIS